MLLRQTVHELPDVTSGTMDTHQNPLIVDDMDYHSVVTATVDGIINAVDFGQESVDIQSLQADKDAAVDVDDVSSSSVTDHVSQSASSSAVLLTHYQVIFSSC